MSSKTPESIWQPLSGDRQFRILSLQPGTGQELKCTVYEANLDDPPPFEALSYRCDDPTTVSGTLRIAINGTNVKIGVNLDSALRRLRLVDKPRELWVDMLCINQYSSEKAQQILVMHDVYKAAQRVNMWLSAASDDSAIAMRAFPDLVRYLRDQGPEHTISQRDFDLSEENIQRHWVYNHEGPEVISIKKLLQRSWFDRVWTLQEAALSQSGSLFLCGDHTFPYSDMQDFVNFSRSGLALLASTHINPALRLGVEVRQTDALFHSRIVRSLRMDQAVLTGHSIVAYILDVTRRLECTEASDRVLSVARFLPGNLMARLGTCGLENTSRLYTELAIIEIEQGHGTDIISAAGKSQQKPENAPNAFSLPSWVPDWSCTEAYMRLSKQRQIYLIKHKMILYQATGQAHSVMNVTQSNANYLLKVKAKVLGAIQRSLPFSSPPKTAGLEGASLGVAQDEKFLALERYLKECLELTMSHDNSVYGEHAITACRHTLLAGYLPQTYPGIKERQHPNPTDEEVDQVFEDALITCTYDRLHKKLLSQLRGRDVQTYTEEERTQLLFLHNAKPRYEALNARDEPDPRWAFHNMSLFCRGRSFFISHDSHVGLAPAAALQDDTLCLFAGCSTPFLIRSVPNGRWSLIGECYIHGWMQGELLKDSREDFWDGEIVLE